MTKLSIYIVAAGIEYLQVSLVCISMIPKITMFYRMFAFHN